MRENRKQGDDEDQSQRGNITIKDRNGKTVCRVPFDTPARGEAGLADDHDRAVLIVEAVNAQLDDQIVQSLPTRYSF